MLNKILILILFLPGFGYCANIAQQFRDDVQAQYPGATIEERGRTHILHKHPTQEKYILNVSQGPIHILNTETEINTAWEDALPGDSPYFKRMVTADYNVYAGLNSNVSFGAGQIIKYVDPVTGESVSFQPQDLNWTNQWDSSAFISSPQNVSAQITDDTLFWPGAYGTGRNFKWVAGTTRLQKFLLLNSLAELGAPPGWIISGGGAALKIQFLFQKSAGVQIWFDPGSGYEQWNQNSTIETTNAIQFRRATDQTILWVFNPGKAIDQDYEAIVKTKLTNSGSVLFVQIIVPWDWLENASYPVVIDPTIDPQVGTSANDGDNYSGSGGFSSSRTKIRPGYSTNAIVNEGNGYFLFTGISAIQNSTIDVAYLSVYPTLSVGTPLTAIGGERASSPIAPVSTADFGGRVPTTAQVDWDGTLTTGSFQNSPSIVSVIQEIVDDFTPTSLMIFMADDGSGTGSNNIHEIDSYDNSTTNAAKLHIEYSFPSRKSPIFFISD